jgi:hypothetical protein
MAITIKKIIPNLFQNRCGFAFVDCPRLPIKKNAAGRVVGQLAVVGVKKMREERRAEVSC